MPKTNSNTNTDQIRQLENKVHLAGVLAELSEINEGTTSTGIPYISFSGAVQCGPSAVETVRFRSFVKSKKSDGTDSKNFIKVKEWVKTAVPMTKDKEKATKVDMVGSLTDNPYVNNAGTLVEATQYNVQLFGEFKEYAAEIDLEGFIHSIVDETKGADSDELTGRQRLRLISRDIFRNTLDIKNIIIPKDLVRPLRDEGYERGSTTTFYVTLTPNAAPAPAKKGGIGVQRSTTTGNSYLEWVMTGASEVIPSDDEKALSSKLIKDAMTERKTRLDEIKEAGYQGGSTSSSSSAPAAHAASAASAASRNSVSGKSNSEVTMTPIVEDDDFPF